MYAFFHVFDYDPFVILKKWLNFCVEFVNLCGVLVIRVLIVLWCSDVRR